MLAKDRYGGYCCAAKQYYLHDDNLVKTLEISPRVLIYKKSLHMKNSYEQLLMITNTGLYARHLIYYTDSPEDTYIKVHNNLQYIYIEPNYTMHIKIDIIPKEKKAINRRRHIFIEAEHPNIRFEIPIIITAGKKEPSIPQAIQFTRSIPKTLAFYEFILYNPSAESKSVDIKTQCPVLKIALSSKVLPKWDYVRALVTLDVQSLKCFEDTIKVKFGKSAYMTIACLHRPIPSILYVSVSHVHFEELKLNREARKEFIICNESHLHLSYNVKFLMENAQTEERQSKTEQETEKEFKMQYPLETSQDSLASDTEELEQKTALAPNKLDLNGHQHFGVNTQGGQVNPNSFNIIPVIFRPSTDYAHFDDNQEAPFLITAKIICSAMSELNPEQRTIVVTGLIIGPDIELSPTTFDVRVYMGEEHCENITALNMDGKVDAKIFLKEYTNKSAANVVMTPAEGLSVEANKCGVFRMSFYTQTLGKFLVRLRFKVKNGSTYNIVVKCLSLPVRLKFFPDIVELGSVPVAVPQKRSILMVNPLRVPVTVQCKVSEDGEEVPLVFNVCAVNDMPPITIKDPVRSLKEDGNECEEQPPVVPHIITEVDANNSQVSFRSISENTTVSSRFDEEVVERLFDMANTLVYTIKRKRFSEKNEAEGKTLDQVLRCLVGTDYFKELTANTNYAYMDWNALPNDPKEIYCENDVIYLSPNGGKRITVLVIPNKLGYHNCALEMRVCPFIEKEECLEENESTLVNSKLMISKLWVEYNCRIPDIVWTDLINFNDRVIYVGQKYAFNFKFDNRSNVGGFIYFDIVPNSECGSMTFEDDVWKFYLAPDSNIYIYCHVLFKKIGKVELPGIVKFVGHSLGMPFLLSADVLPLKVRITPKYIYHRQKVLERTKVYVYIDNVTPTFTRISCYLKFDRYQYLDTCGTILAPTGQGICVGIYTKIDDPEIYKNMLYVDMHCGTILEVPLSFNIEGMPIFFDPDITDKYNVGVILTNTEQNYHDNIPNFSRVIRVYNYGKGVYRLTIQKLKTGPPKCGVTEVKARLQVTPKCILLEPGSEERIQITANSCEEVTVYNEFRILIINQVNRQRFMSVRFVVTAQFVQPHLNWSRKQICMNYYRTHWLKEHMQLELVTLTNVADVAIDSVNLRVLGPFKIKELFEHQFGKELQFEIAGLEKKQFTIVLIKGKIKNKYCTHVAEGRIICTANGRAQRSLPLKLNIYNPELRIAQPDMILFKKNYETDVVLRISNIGCLDAHYKWVKLNENRHYVSEVDNSWELAHELLSDIMRMLDLGEDESDVDSLYQRNMSLRYQKYHCRLQKLGDPIGVSVILNEIIDNLDLEHKRFTMHLDEVIEQDTDMDKSSLCSSKAYFGKIIEHIIGTLELEESYEVSPASSDDCKPERSVFFYEKTGILPPMEQSQCLLHLPGVRNGYATKADFELQIVGGVTQTFSITLVNLERTILLSKTSIYLGVRPWYELFKVISRILSVTQYTVNIRLEELPITKSSERIAKGYINIRNEKRVDILEYGNHLVRMDGIMGFNDEFQRDIKVVVNDSDALYIRVRGQGVMPILTVTDKMDRIEQEDDDIVNNYKMLQRIYYFEMFKSITEVDEDLPLGEEDENASEVSKLVENLSQLSLTESNSSFASSSRERRFARFMQSYLQVNNNGELPDALLLEQLIDTEKFLEHVKVNADVHLLLHMVYQDHVKLTKCYDEKMPINLKHFTVQPLPCEMHGYILNMSGLKMDSVSRFEMNLHFFGPGKLIAAARTVIRIPGLAADFRASNSDEQTNDKEFLFYMSEDKKPDMFDKRYRNMYERIIDKETDIKLKHAHSFDIDVNVHRRDVTAKDRKNIKNYYNSLNKSVYMEHKHHYILSKIFTNSNRNFSGTHFRVVVLFKPESKYYEVEQLLEDFLYIDLHMGPTLPILMRGMICKN